MNLQSASLEQLKEIVTIKEQITGLEQKLAKLLGEKTSPEVSTNATAKKGRKKMSAAAKAKIGAAAKARWAKIKGTAPAQAQSVAPKVVAAAKPAKKAKRKLSPEGRAKIVAALKKRWAAKKKAK